MLPLQLEEDRISRSVSKAEKLALQSPVVRYGLALTLTLTPLAFLCRQFMVGQLGSDLPAYITFYPIVMITAILAGPGPGLLATVVAVRLAVYWMLPPVGRFAVEGASAAFGLALFTFMGAWMSVVAELYRRARGKSAAYDKESALKETRASAGKALRESEERQRLALDSTAEAICSLDRRGNLTFCNQACLRIPGYESAEDVLGKNMHAVVHHTGADGTPCTEDKCPITPGPVVVLTASREEQDLVRGYRLRGANSYIQEPLDFDESRKAVKEIGLFRLIVNHAPPAAAF